MVTQEDTIFVSGMNTEITEEEICEHFGAIGIIKVCKRSFFGCEFNVFFITIKVG